MFKAAFEDAVLLAGGPWLFGRTDSVPVPSKLELGSPRAPERDENLH